MGKGNRTRNERATETLATVTPRQASKKKSMPTWVGTLIVVAVLALLVLFVTFVVLNSRGTFNRMRTFAETENYEVTVPMMSYMVYTKYQSTVSMYDQYSSQFGANIQIGGGEGGNALDKTKSLRDQIYSAKKDEQGNVVEQKTWFEYFAEAAEKDVCNYLAYCEEARLNGMKLEKEDKEFIKDQLDTLEAYAAENGYSTNGYVSLLYGKGVILKDVRNMMEIIQLATKWSEKKADEFFNGVSNERMEEHYAANKSTYDIYCDYTSYSFVTTFVPSQNADAATAATESAAAAEKYKAEQEKFAGYVEKLSKATDAATFKAELYNCLYAEELLKSEEAKGSALTEAEQAACSKAAEDKVMKAMHTNMSADNEGENEEELYKWLFESKTENNVKVYLRKAGDVKKFEETEKAYEEPAEGEAIKYEEAMSIYTAGCFNAGMHRNDDMVRSVGHILFKSKTFDGLTSTAKLTGVTKEVADRVLARDGVLTAYAMAGELLDMMLAEGKITEATRQDGSKYYKIDKSVFEEYGNTYTEDSSVFYDNVYKGQMVKEYEDWLFDAVRVEGEISYPEPVKTDYGYHIMYYVGNEIEGWKSDIRVDLSEADNTAYLEGIQTAHPVTFNRDLYRYIVL